MPYFIDKGHIFTLKNGQHLQFWVQPDLEGIERLKRIIQNTGGAIAADEEDADFFLLDLPRENIKVFRDSRANAIEKGKVALRYSWIIACIKHSAILPWWDYAYFAPTNGLKSRLAFETETLKKAEMLSEERHIHALASSCALLFPYLSLPLLQGELRNHRLERLGQVSKENISNRKGGRKRKTVGLGDDTFEYESLDSSSIRQAGTSSSAGKKARRTSQGKEKDPPYTAPSSSRNCRNASRRS